MENSARDDQKSSLFSDSYPAKRQHFLRKRDWSKMADDVCRIIVGKLWFSAHQCRFAAACRDWYRVAREAPCPFEQNTPFLLIPHNDEIETGNCSLYHVADSRTFPLNVPELRGKHVHGSCKGWLVAADDDYELSLINVLTRTQIALPEPLHALAVLEERYPAAHMLIPALRDCWMKKFAVSDSPTSASSSSAPAGSGCLVAAVMSLPREIFFCCLGDESWTRIELMNGSCTGVPTDDLMFFRGRLYAASYVFVIVVDFDGPRYTKAVSMRGPRRTIRHTNGLHALRVYLVECSDSLLYVHKFGKITNTDVGVHHTTYGFEVYKLEEDAQTWSRIHELCGHSLFLGLNQSVAISAEEVPWCRPNSIYYLDDVLDYVCDGPGFHSDTGVFSLEDGRIELFDKSYSAACRGSPSLWFQQKIR